VSLPQDLTQRQSSRSLRSAQANATFAARALLTSALKFGIHVGTDGDEVVMVVPLKVPYETRRLFEIWLDNFRDEVIAVIQREARS
jgi:hypothetical protein